MKSLLVFDHFYMTSMLAYMKDDLLYIQISRADWEVPKRREKQPQGLPETFPGVHPLDFRLIVDKGMTLAEARAAWPDKLLWSNINLGCYELPPDALKQEIAVTFDTVPKAIFAIKILNNPIAD